MKIDQILGLTEDHLSPLEVNGSWLQIHTEAKSSFEALKKEALKEFTIDLYPVSIFRSFEKQKSIWNAKAGGHRTLLNARGEEIDAGLLSEEEKLWAILRWSALPGASRHHWGSDLDVIDTIALHHYQESFPYYRVELTPSEFEEKPFSGLHNWLTKKIGEEKSHGFFRPYSQDLGGVSPEPWHLSYWPVAGQTLSYFTLEKFRDALESSIYKDLELIDVVKYHADKIYRSYVTNVSPPPFS